MWIAGPSVANCGNADWVVTRGRGVTTVVREVPERASNAQLAVFREQS